MSVDGEKESDTGKECGPPALSAGVTLRAYWNLLARHVRPQKGRFFLLALLVSCGVGLRIGAPQVMRSFIDGALAGKPLAALAFAAATFIVVAVASQGVSILVTWLGENVSWTATNDLRCELAAHALALDMGFHNDHPPGELIERIDGDVTELADFFSQFALNLVSNLLLLVGILAALFIESREAGFAFSAFSAATLLVMGRLKDIALPDQKARRKAEADLYGFVEEQLSGTEDIRSSGAVGYSVRELFRHQAMVLVHNRRSHFKRWISENTMGLALTLGNVLAFSLGYLLFRAGTITVGTVYLFIHYVNLLEEPFWAMTHELESFQTIGACAERLSEFKNLEPKVRGGPGTTAGANPPAGARARPRPASVSFENVVFSYNDRGPVIDGVSLSLEPGAVLGLLGRTGSGKTTMARLAFRLYDPAGGTIRLDGSDLRDWTLAELRARMAIVTQDVQLFRASVRDNLTFFDRSIPDGRIVDAIRELELGDWFSGLPDGLDTELASGSRGLSAGEAQLLAFTRVFLRDPGLVMLDEASSRLDPATEQRLERVIDRLLAGRTAIVIAHRLETVDRASDIMILERGKAVECGRREELAADPDSRFSRLSRTGLDEVLA